MRQTLLLSTCSGDPCELCLQVRHQVGHLLQSAHRTEDVEVWPHEYGLTAVLLEPAGVASLKVYEGFVARRLALGEAQDMRADGIEKPPLAFSERSRQISSPKKRKALSDH